ncbi:hypothetical protein C9J03_25295 [Photobacterium gaetbulicola]|uniref:P pilus assembly protein, chaperone PapD n=1 Tax=Photobacterium gaetbulicola Gung47 TaxID=658445 RepID=A0A0C4JN05_9GAMM|nr:hypothetical protein [Photobacterium gaetbulicola]AHA59179.1 hypothetical protein H744_p0050 [Photobacterium gaetbulicola Gung47]PSU00005.1 hypothetical protein C9J03_25295 [Photobacterium gaetbulicola]
MFYGLDKSMLYPNYFSRLLLAFIVFFSVPAPASVMQVSVPSKVTILDSNSKDSSSLIQVSNPDKDTPRFVKIGVYYIDPDSIGTGKEKLIEIKGKLKKDNLIVLPEKIAIPPNGRTNVRAIYTGKELDADRNYKIRFYPITEIEYTGTESKEEKKATLFFSISSTTFATVVKSNPAYQLDVDGGRLTNNGDSITLLQNCNICRENDCKVFTEFRLPPKRQLDFNSIINGDSKLTWQCDLVEPGAGKRVITSQ